MQRAAQLRNPPILVAACLRMSSAWSDFEVNGSILWQEAWHGSYSVEQHSPGRACTKASERGRGAYRLCRNAHLCVRDVLAIVCTHTDARRISNAVFVQPARGLFANGPLPPPFPQNFLRVASGRVLPHHRTPPSFSSSSSRRILAAAKPARRFSSKAADAADAAVAAKPPPLPPTPPPPPPPPPAPPAKKKSGGSSFLQRFGSFLMGAGLGCGIGYYHLAKVSRGRGKHPAFCAEGGGGGCAPFGA